MYDGYWDDYMNDGTPTPDNIRNVYDIDFNGEKYTSLQSAWKDSIYRDCGIRYNRDTRITMLKVMGAVIRVREYNDTKKQWHTNYYQIL